MTRPGALRIAILRPYAMLPSEGGANDRYVNLSRALAALGAEPQFFCSDFLHNAKRRRAPADLEMNAARLPFLRQVRSIAYSRNLSLARIAHELAFGAKALWALARGPRPDAVLVGEPLFCVGWLALLYGLVFRVCVLADVIDLWPEADADRAGVASALRGALYGALKISRALRLRLYRDVSFVSRTYADRLRPGAPVFYWGSELAPRAEGGAHAPPLSAIYAGSLGLGYDIATLLEAAAILRDEGAPVRILVAGSGPRLADVRRAHEDGRIEYLGQLGREALIEAYQGADVGLLPYAAGSVVAMPIKLFDYLNFGLAIVSSLEMEARELVESRQLGLVFAPGDARALAGALARLARDRDGLGRARAASAALAGEFSIPVQYPRFARFTLDRASRSGSGRRPGERLDADHPR